MAQSDLNIEVKFRFWLMPYLYGVALMSKATGAEPNFEKVNFWLKKGLKISLIDGNGKRKSI